MLDSRTRDRIGGISGIVSALMFAAGWAFWRVPGLPNMSSAIDVSRWFVEHQNACRVAAILGSLSLLFMIWFDVCLYGILRKAEGGDGVATRAFFGGALISLAFNMLFCQFLFVVAWRPGKTLPEVTQALNDVFLGPGVAAFGCIMAMFVAIAVVVIRRGGLPVWLGYSAAAVAAFQVLFIPTSFVYGGIFDISDGLLGVYVPLGTPVIWTVAASVAMLRRSAAEAGEVSVAPRADHRREMVPAEV